MFAFRGFAQIGFIIFLYDRMVVYPNAIKKSTFFLHYPLKKTTFRGEVETFSEECNMKNRLFLSTIIGVLTLTSAIYCGADNDNDQRSEGEPVVAGAGAAGAAAAGIVANEAAIDTVGLAMMGAGTAMVATVVAVAVFAPRSTAAHSHVAPTPIK